MSVDERNAQGQITVHGQGPANWKRLTISTVALTWISMLLLLASGLRRGASAWADGAPNTTTIAAMATAPHSLDKVSLQLKWTHQFQFAGYYAAVQQGYYRDAGLDVTLIEGGPETDPATILESGKAQYAVGLPNMLLSFAEGKHVVALAAIFQHSPEALLVSQSSGITSPHSVCGQSLMISPNDTPAIYAMFRNEGVPVNCFTEVPHNSDLGKLTSGEVAGMGVYTTTEPYFFDKQGTPYTLLNPRTYGVDFYGDCLFTSQAELESHPERVKAFRAASLRGWQYAMNHQDEMIGYIMANYGEHLTREQLAFEAAEMRKLMFADLIEVGHMNAGRWRHIADTYTRLGLLRPGTSMDGFLYATPEVMDESGYYDNLSMSLVVTGSIALVFGLGAMALAAVNRRISSAEKALRRSQAMLKMVLDTIPVRVFWKDRASVYQGCNQAFAGDANLPSPSAIVGKTENDMPWQERAPGLIELDRAVISSGRPIIGYEEHLSHQDGSEWHMRTSKIPLRNDDSTIIGVLGVYEDITDTKRAEHERVELNRRIQQAQKYESLTTLAGGVAHHFNNLLQIIIGNTELATLLIAPGSEMEALLEEIRKASERARHLSRQMLACSGNLVQPERELKLNPLISDMMPALGTTISRSIQLHFQPSPERLLVEGDPYQLRQLLLNLVANAAESYVDERGTVFLRTGKITCDAAYLAEPHSPGDLQPGDYVYLDVIDEGVGMTPQTRDRIFDPFFSTKMTGRGLGMAATLGIVRAHGGTIKITTRPGHGTTMRILLPQVIGLKDSNVGAASAPVNLHGDGTLLLVDDEVALLQLGRDILSSVGFHVVTAQSGDAALAVFREAPDEFCCVLLDLVMPGMDGMETLLALRAIRPDLPIIIITGNRSEAAAATLKSHNVVGILYKPYELNHIYAMLHKALNPGKSDDSTGSEAKNATGGDAGASPRA